MAQLKDTLIQGSARVTDTLYGSTVELTSLVVPNADASSTYSAGSAGQVLTSNGSSVYWSSLGGAASYSITDSSSASAIGTGTTLVTERDVYYGLPTINNSHNYTSSTTIYAPTAGGTTNYVLMGNGTTAAPIWKTPKDALTIMINALDTGPSVLTANDYIITQYVGGGTSNTTYYRRPASAVRVGGLLTARKLKVALGSTTDVTFDGTADQTSIPISGTLDIAHGGTGATTAAGIREALNLSSAMHFIGVATVAITDGSKTDPKISEYNFSTQKSAGDVIIDKDSHREYVWSTAGKWEMLGFDASQQFSKTTTGNTFISSVTQNTDGTVSADSRALNTSGDWTGNAGSATKLKTARNLAVALGSTTAVTFDGTANCTSIPVSGVLGIANGGTGANTAQGAVQALGVSGIYYVYGTQTAKTYAWTGNLTTVSELYAGLTIAYYLPYDGTSSNATLNLTLAGNQQTGAKPVYYSANTRFTTHLAAHSVLILTWVPDTTSAGGAWRRGDRDTDANSKVYVYWKDTPNDIELPLMAASSNNSGAFAEPDNGEYTSSFALISTNYPKVNPSTGCVTLYDLKVTNKIIGKLNTNYGEVLPANPTEGQIFFQLSEPYYELPIGGSTGQCLVKRSNTDRDVMWGTSVPNGGTTGQALIKASDADGDVSWGASIPNGGTTGQALIKNSDTNGDVSWGNVNANDKVSKSGDTMTGHLILQGAPGGIPAIRCTFPFLTRGVAPSQTYYSTHVWLDSNNNRLAQIEYTKATNASNFNFGLLADTTDGNHWGGLILTAALNNSNASWVTLNANAGTITGAVWNDYAEMRAVPLPKNITPGSCVYEMGDDTMAPTYQRLQKGCKIVSDTFGFNIGETDTAKTPIAVAGRALVYLFEGREAARNAIGEFVCSGPNGTVSIMTTEEYLQNPQAVVGTISAVPDYEEWGSTNVKVNGRIWIYVR